MKFANGNTKKQRRKGSEPLTLDIMVRPKGIKGNSLIKKTSRSLPKQINSAAGTTAKVRPYVCQKLKDKYAEEKKLITFLTTTKVNVLISSKIFRSVGHINWEALYQTRKPTSYGNLAGEKGIKRISLLLDSQDPEEKKMAHSNRLIAAL